jgi:hypothetical protein
VIVAAAPALLARHSQSWASPALDPRLSTLDPTVRVRPANQPFVDEANELIAKVQTRTERLAARAGKTDELRGKSDSLKKEIVDLFRAIHQISQLGDELLLRGERDGETVRSRAQELLPPLGAAVTELRPSLGSPQGLGNAMIRRAKEQLAELKQLDELIKRRKWTDARDKLESLREQADDVGRFPDQGEAEQLFKPLMDRVGQVRAGYLAEKKPSLTQPLRDEFATLRPDLNALRLRLAAVSSSIKEKQPTRWNDRPIGGPELLNQLVETWPTTDQAVSQAAAVLHVIGPPAEAELISLRADYEAARVQAVALVRELILAEPSSLTAADAEARYTGYLEVIPRFTNALRAAPEEILATAGALNQLAARSPELAARISRYRAATDDELRWRRRFAQRVHKNLREKKAPAGPVAQLLVKPPPLPGQEGPGGLKRTNQTFWSIEQPPEFVASVWSEHWKGVTASIQKPTVRWPTGSDPQFVSAWHGRAVVEATFPRAKLNELNQTLARDLLTDKNHPPLTIETALALHTATFGPFLELAGGITGAAADHLPDRLFDLHEPLDLPGSFSTSSIVAYPAIPALVRLQVQPTWIVHDLFVWSDDPPPSSTPTPTPKAPDVAAQTPKEPVPAAESKPAADAPTAVQPATSAAPPAGVAKGAESPPVGPAAKKGDVPKQSAPAPPGGVKF